MSNHDVAYARRRVLFGLALLAAYLAPVALAAPKTYAPAQVLRAVEYRGDFTDAAPRRFGRSVAIDGNTVAVGATREPGNLLEHPGGVTIYVREPGAWRQQARLEAPSVDGTSATGFGTSIALAGDTLVVGAPKMSVFGGFKLLIGAAFVYQRRGDSWEHSATLFARDGEGFLNGEGLDAFGYAVAISGNHILIGAPGAEGPGSIIDPVNANHGAAYVFELRSGVWHQLAKLSAPDGTAENALGSSVALTDGVALVGSVGAAQNRGAVDVFDPAANWRQTQKLVAPDGNPGDNFGISLSGGQSIALVGAYLDDIDGRVDQGSVHAFVRSGGRWTHEAKLVDAGGAPGANFGWSIDLTADRAIVGSWGMPTGGNPTHLFRRTAGQWTQEAVAPRPREAASHDDVAMAVGLDGAIAVAGFPHVDFGSTDDRGIVHVFEQRDERWEEALIQTGSSARGELKFGSDVAVDDVAGVMVVGAPVMPAEPPLQPQAPRGSVYIYLRDGDGSWQLDDRVTLDIAAPAKGFGHRVAVSGSTALVATFTPGVDGSWPSNPVHVVSRESPEEPWLDRGPLLDPDGTPIAGRSFAIDGDQAIIANYEDIRLFVRTPTGWQQEAHFPAGRIARGDTVESVALQGSFALVGVPLLPVDGRPRGAVYVLVKHEGRWLLEARLLSSPTQADATFGSSVAFDRDTAVIGAAGDHAVDAAAGASGAAYVFVRTAVGWVEQTRLTQGERQGFGHDVAIDGDTLAVSSGSGAVAAYRRSQGVWSLVDFLGSADSRAVALDGDDVIVGDSTAEQVTVFRDDR